MDDETYEAGDDVFVIDSAFEPVVQRGIVGLRDSDGRGVSIDVEFDTDPFDSDSDESRRVGADPMQIIHTDAGPAEMFRLFSDERGESEASVSSGAEYGREDLIEPED